MGASIYDVAKRAGVSISTVSRILNSSANVREDKVKAVREAMEYLKYEPNQFARGLVKQKTNLVGIYLPTAGGSVFDSQYNMELMKGIEGVLARRGYGMVILSSLTDSGKNPVYVEYIRQKRIDGLILGSVADGGEMESLRKLLRESSFPTVYIGKRIHTKGLNVYARFEEYHMEMIRLLRKNGHRNIALFISPGHKHYLSALLNRCRQELPEITLYPVFTRRGENRSLCTEDSIKTVLDKSCTALISPSTEEALAITGELSRLDLKVPEDVSVITVEHKKGAAALIPPGISAMYVPAGPMGTAAASLLVTALEKTGQEELSREFFPCYISRNSVKAI